MLVSFHVVKFSLFDSFWFCTFGCHSIVGQRNAGSCLSRPHNFLGGFCCAFTVFFTRLRFGVWANATPPGWFRAVSFQWLPLSGSTTGIQSFNSPHKFLDGFCCAYTAFVTRLRYGDCATSPGWFRAVSIQWLPLSGSTTGIQPFNSPLESIQRLPFSRSTWPRSIRAFKGFGRGQCHPVSHRLGCGHCPAQAGGGCGFHAWILSFRCQQGRGSIHSIFSRL